LAAPQKLGRPMTLPSMTCWRCWSWTKTWKCQDQRKKNRVRRSESGVGLIPINVTKIRGPTSDERQRLEFHHGVAGHFKWLASTGMVPMRMPQ
jgi:hypothetical protein